MHSPFNSINKSIESSSSDEDVVIHLSEVPLKEMGM